MTLSSNLKIENENDIEYYKHTKFISNILYEYIFNNNGEMNKDDIMRFIKRYSTMSYVFWKRRSDGDLGNFFSEVSLFFSMINKGDKS